MPGYSGLEAAGGPLMIAGAVASAVSAYYGAQAARYDAKARALDAEFESTMAAMDARAGENAAQLELQAGQRAKAAATLAYRQQERAQVTETAASGTAVGVGSAAEVQASIRLAKEIDANTIEANAVSAANAQRSRSVAATNRQGFANVRARSLRMTARSISPFAAAAASLLSSSSTVAGYYLNRERGTAAQGAG